MSHDYLPFKYTVIPRTSMTAPTKRSAAENGGMSVTETGPTETEERGKVLAPAPATIITMPMQIKVMLSL